MDPKADELNVQMRLEFYLEPSTYRALKAKAEVRNLSASEYVTLLIHQDLKRN